jgi:alginate O-acetyltransferase complex protein AlgI
MVFSSSYFLFLFLPVALALCVGLRGQGYLLASLLVSVFFYFWSAGADALILIGLIVGNYVCALRLSRARSTFVFVTMVISNVAVLFWFKYARFVFRNLDVLLGTSLESIAEGVTLPAGVSFFVFQAISYITDVYRRDVAAERNPLAYGAYQAFFPHLIAGPIVRFRDVIGDFREPRMSIQAFSTGTARFAHGLLKKTIIADGVSPIADAVFALKAHQVDFAIGWIGAIAYSVQIYFDFSGYSDMAIGLAQMFGIRFHENFERPYASRSITEFWRRWHISLSSWFRDYVYISLGGSRAGTLITYRNLLIVFLVTGLWHGAAWTFVLWGLYHGAFLVIERIAFQDPAKSLRSRALRYAYCLPVIIFGWVLFRAPTLRRTFHLWKSMLSPFHTHPLEEILVRTNLTPFGVAALVAGAIILVLPGQSSLGGRLSAELAPRWQPFGLGYTAAALLISGIAILTGSYSPFLYFNF